MSELITATSVAVASKVLAASVATAATAGVVGGVMATAGLGKLLAELSFWDDLDRPPCVETTAVVNFGSMEVDFLSLVDANHARLLQTSTGAAPTASLEAVAAITALTQSPIVSLVAGEKFAAQVAGVTEEVVRLPNARVDIAKLNRRTSALIEASLGECRSRMNSFLRREFEASLGNCGWTLKDEARSESSSAFIATNAAAQRLSAHIDYYGQISVDLAGFNGRGCEAALSKLFKALRSRGIQCNRLKEEPHFNFRGGWLSNGTTTAAQVLANATKKTASSRSLPGREVATARTQTDKRKTNAVLLNGLRSRLVS